LVWARGQDARATWGWGIRIRIRIRVIGFAEGGEVGGAEGADFVAEVEVDADEFVAVNPGEVAFGDGGFDVGLDFGEASEVGFARGKGLFVEGFEVDGAEGADVRGELAVPIDQGALGDMEVGGDAREAEAFGAEFGELIFSTIVIHGASFRTFQRARANVLLAVLAVLAISLWGRGAAGVIWGWCGEEEATRGGKQGPIQVSLLGLRWYLWPCYALDR
jgi:hypothetical protein